MYYSLCTCPGYLLLSCSISLTFVMVLFVWQPVIITAGPYILSLLVPDFQCHLKKLEIVSFLLIHDLSVQWMRCIFVICNHCVKLLQVLTFYLVGFLYFYCCCLMYSSIFRSICALQIKRTKLWALLKYF